MWNVTALLSSACDLFGPEWEAVTVGRRSIRRCGVARESLSFRRKFQWRSLCSARIKAEWIISFPFRIMCMSNSRRKVWPIRAQGCSNQWQRATLKALVRWRDWIDACFHLTSSTLTMGSNKSLLCSVSVLPCGRGQFQLTFKSY